MPTPDIKKRHEDVMIAKVDELVMEKCPYEGEKEAKEPDCESCYAFVGLDYSKTTDANRPCPCQVLGCEEAVQRVRDKLAEISVRG